VLHVNDRRPSPGDAIATIGHIAAGIAISSGAGYLRDWLVLATLTVCAVSPDIDFLLGTTHRGLSHSIGFAVVVSAIAAGLMWWRHRPRPVLIGMLAFLAVGSHLVLDIVTAPEPLPALWPLSRREFALDDAILPATPPLGRLLDPGGLLEMTAEILWSSLLVGAAIWVDARWRSWRARQASGPGATSDGGRD
jgi:LexA-binding, inner membrane-associated putative hydrolase